MRRRGGRRTLRGRARTLAELLDAAERPALIELVRQLVALSPEAERTCFEYLRAHTAGTPEAKAGAAAGVAHALWSEIEPDLAELDDLGGGDYATQDDVTDRLHELEQLLRKHPIHRDDRRELLDDVLPYIQSGNAGMDDALYDVAYATCCGEEDLRNLAKHFEAIAIHAPLRFAQSFACSVHRLLPLTLLPIEGREIVIIGTILHPVAAEAKIILAITQPPVDPPRVIDRPVF